jgi:hypothetical protein
MLRLIHFHIHVDINICIRVSTVTNPFTNVIDDIFYQHFVTLLLLVFLRSAYVKTSQSTFNFIPPLVTIHRLTVNNNELVKTDIFIQDLKVENILSVRS